MATTQARASALQQGNMALRKGDVECAIRHYAAALLERGPDLANMITGNLELAQARYRRQRTAPTRPAVAVCGWELAHNAAGRVYTLAQLYERFAEVEIIGTLFPKWGREVWEPILDTKIPKHTFVVEEESRFIDQALELVRWHPYDVVHLSKPRMPNVIVGLLYKLVWGSKVLMDIDDEELAVVGANAPVSPGEVIERYSALPELGNLAGKMWTQIAVGMVGEFDAVTVANPALQKRYGGVVIRHARDEKCLALSGERRIRSREKYGIPPEKKVVLFFGTPRRHKGLLETANLISEMGRDDLLFVVAGEFTDEKLKAELQKTLGDNCRFLGNFPYSEIADIAAMGDICPLLQDVGSEISRFQVPAKLSDALSVGLPVVIKRSPANADLADTGALHVVDDAESPSALLNKVLNDASTESRQAMSREVFLEQLSIQSVAPKLMRHVESTQRRPSAASYDEDFTAGRAFIQRLVRNRAAIVSANGHQRDIDIVVPVYNALEDVKKCLASIDRNTDGYQVRVLVVNDFSDPTTSEWLREYCKGSARFTLIEHNRNRGYTCAVNTGLRASEAPYVITQNSDTIVTGGWLRGMVRCMDSDERIGIVGPLSNAASWQNVPELYGQDGNFAVNSLPKSMEVEDMASVVRSASECRYPRTSFVNGFCMMIRRQVLDRIGYMDERRFPEGYGEENDFCVRTLDAGFYLAYADDVYVFHAKSKSFGAARKVELSRAGSEANKKKHGVLKYNRLVERVKDTAEMDHVRARIRKMLDRCYKGKLVPADSLMFRLRIVFLLPVRGGGGGAHSVLQEATEMRRLGVDARVAVRDEYFPEFEKLYADIPECSEVLLPYKNDERVDLGCGADVVVATIFSSVKMVAEIVSHYPNVVPAYYIQDYEPWFFDQDDPSRQEALESYDRIPNAVCFAKTHWICREVARRHNVQVEKVAPSIDHSVYRPADSLGSSGSETFTIAAMVRPRTPRRGAGRTIELLRRLKSRFSERLKIEVFGCTAEELEQVSPVSDSEFELLGVLNRTEVASVLQRADVFVDMSDYQAFGRTALEAMACGAAALVPSEGGADEYARDGINAVMANTMDVDECERRLSELLESPGALQEMKLVALETASGYSTRRAALSELIVLARAVSRHQENYIAA